MANKAHTATLNRICRRYGLSATDDGTPFDIETPDFAIEVETSASIADVIDRLSKVSIPVYIAVTNKEGIGFAKKLVVDTQIGLLDPQGNVIRDAGDHKLES